MLRRLAAKLPRSIQQELRRWQVVLAIRRGRFGSSEPEYALLPELVQPGDWVIDVGANVGEYTLCLSELVGPEGRVFAVEPIAATAEILATAVQHSPYGNITILNLGAANEPGVRTFHLPAAESGLPNYRQARVSNDGEHSAYCLPLDQLAFPHRIALVKIDAETYEDKILDGLRQTIARDKPVLLIEGHEGLHQRLAPLGYRLLPRKPGSPNILLVPGGQIRDLPPDEPLETR